eukprot:CAMPEP_0175057468 /NCGR_PEP_ID=MMETSP0052_2-20121109/11281_1 /TAXON_ID=51329 ORGANISM="Polytomella parva, Strain SAG 63-3" /NCGR_SAMPLE_ID=MMETSP0052_2 /ASSEMBLY_ACC=CAM_ASM_000194 /LENGTH=530 /DNA_ID=CAMNT_0016322685 /DNA_START=37 /DNA_END=1627 /DNA_ORIENTATION=-
MTTSTAAFLTTTTTITSSTSAAGAVGGSTSTASTNTITTTTTTTTLSSSSSSSSPSSSSSSSSPAPSSAVTVCSPALAAERKAHLLRQWRQTAAAPLDTAAFLAPPAADEPTLDASNWWLSHLSEERGESRDESASSIVKPVDGNSKMSNNSSSNNSNNNGKVNDTASRYFLNDGDGDDDFLTSTATNNNLFDNTDGGGGSGGGGNGIAGSLAFSPLSSANDATSNRPRSITYQNSRLLLLDESMEDGGDKGERGDFQSSSGRRRRHQHPSDNENENENENENDPDIEKLNRQVEEQEQREKEEEEAEKQRASLGLEVVSMEICRRTRHLVSLAKTIHEIEASRKWHLAYLQRSAEVRQRVNLGLVEKVVDIERRLAATRRLLAAEAAEADAKEAVSRLCPRRYRLRGTHALHVVSAPEPTDITYENLELGFLERLIRLLLSLAFGYGVLLLGFALISLAPAIRKGIWSVGTGSNPLATSSSNATTQCTSTCNYMDHGGNLYLSAMDRLEYKQCYSFPYILNDTTRLSCD